MCPWSKETASSGWLSKWAPSIRGSLAHRAAMRSRAMAEMSPGPHATGLPALTHQAQVVPRCAISSASYDSGGAAVQHSGGDQGLDGGGGVSDLLEHCLVVLTQQGCPQIERLWLLGEPQG